MVLSNRRDVRALEVAERHGLEHRVLDRSSFADGPARDAAIGEAFRAARCDLVLLAGYDQVLRPTYFAAFDGPTINIHPSLLPRHGGSGMMGMAVHASVLAAKDAQSGASIEASAAASKTVIVRCMSLLLSLRRAVRRGPEA